MPGTSVSPQPITAANGINLAQISKGKLPELPHITNNIVPLSNVLRFYTQEAYKQLSRVIENLANTRTSESDIARKKKFLEVIILLRQDFIKIYTLVKWAQNAKDVSKLIDLLNWLRTQEFCFDNLGYGLNELNSFSGAKLPNSDILTSLEVLVNGRPQLPTYNYIAKPKISAEKTLEVIRDLNLTLLARMALINDMPRRFYNNYEVRDGRVIITIPNEFQVSITVANDLIIDDDKDYYKSPFFFIDFAFLFGINPDTSLITYKDAKVITTLPKASRAKLESVVNEALLKQSLTGLYDVLHKYAVSFKLYLISRQLRDLSVNSKWRNNLQYKYNSSLIIINYWCNHYLSRNWKSFIEIGIDKLYNLNFRWFMNGKYNLNHDIQDISGNSDSEDVDDLTVDFILNLIINKHSEILMAKIHSQLASMIPDDSISFVNPYQLLIKLTPRKSTFLAINPLTGFFYFMDPSPLEVLTQNRINSQPAQVKNKNFVSEQDMVNNVVKNLIQLRLDTFNLALNTKLVTSEWIANDFIKINDYETVKLFNFIIDEKATSSNKIQFYRCRNWPSSWFLINMISGLTSKVYWWVARLKSIKGEWKIQWVQKLKFGGEEDLDYEFFNNLSRSCSNMIVDHMVVEELLARRINYVKVDDSTTMDRFNLSHDLQNTSANYETVMALHNTGKLLPISVSSTTLFLIVRLTTVDNATKLILTLSGSLKNISSSDVETFSKFNVTIQPENDTFELLTSVDLSNKMSENSDNSNPVSLLNELFDNMAKVNLLIKMLYQLKKTNILVTNNSANDITFDIDPFYKPFHLRLPEGKSGLLTLTSSPEEDQNVQLLVAFINQRISESHEALVGSIKYLKEYVPIIKSVKKVKDILKLNDSDRLPNKLQRLQFDVKFQNLNLMQFIFHINYVSTSSSKKVLKDRIVFSLTYKRNAFEKNRRLLVKFSMKENLNSHNLKYKKLFESVFKAAGEVQQEKQKEYNKIVLMKLNYDFLIDNGLLEPLMAKVTECFLQFLKNEN
ncbi:CIC11C00000004982 [Sungouiella intermedia]|uniref:Mediator of RNA polymerase II transcription subunit 14 n=1 Tax=Sungouiella intermedia TaxID=45354 RepID=A0A1L0DG48_9ASCO|nr:CIC11C00000003625 [[Candida] intermedia]SGZ55063.1 CIC11C00000004982 [[Candida] intermedia]